MRAAAGDLVQLGEVLSGGSYLSQHDLRIHFGLGVTIALTGGDPLAEREKETLTDLAADQFYFVREGKGVVSTQLPQPAPKILKR